MAEIIEPTVRGMAAEGCRYVGFLYAGVMVTADGPKVLEYNCRLGDPETQPLLMRLRSDLVELCKAALDGRLDEVEVDWDPRPALGVVMTAGGYPGRYRQGDVIEGLPPHDEELGDEVKLFHAGTAEAKDGHIVTHGGRVLCATALGSTVAEAQNLAYNLAKRVHWEGAYYRTDIGYRAIARERGE
jgi:phosphoribosylamine--glycine ligase